MIYQHPIPDEPIHNKSPADCEYYSRYIECWMCSWKSNPDYVVIHISRKIDAECQW